MYSLPPLPPSASWVWCASCSQYDCHSSSHHMETQLQPSHGDMTTSSEEGHFFFSCISILGKNFLPMPKLLRRGNWVSGIGSLYNGSHVLPSGRKEGVRVGGKWLYVCKEWYLPQELFSHLTLSLFQLGFWPFHTVLVKVNSNLHLTKSIGRLSVFLFGLSAALKVGTSSFPMKHLPRLWHQILPVFSLSHWPAFPSLPACSSSSAGLHVLSFPGLPLAISLFTCREGVERDVIKFIFMRIVPIFTSPDSTAPLSSKSEYPAVSSISLLGYIIFSLMWPKRTLESYPHPPYHHAPNCSDKNSWVIYIASFSHT